MRLHNVIALDVIGVGLLAAAISVFGCNNDSASSDDSAAAAIQEQSPASAEAVVPAPPSPAITPRPDTAVKQPREVSYAEAEAAYNDRRYAEATDLFTRYTDTKPQNPWGHYMLGLSARKAGDSETAERAFNRALELDPKHVKSMLNLSRVLLDTGRPDDAMEQLYAVFEIDPESGAAYRLQGRAMHQLGDPSDAIAAYQDAIRIDSTDAWSINNLGLIYIEQGRFEEALPALARATELRNDVAVFRNNLGIALENNGHFRDAEDAYRAAVDLDAGYETAATNLARVSEVAQDPATTPADLEQLAQEFVASSERWTSIGKADGEEVAVDAPTLRQ